MGTSGGEPAGPLRAEVVVTRLPGDRWRVDYAFDRPVGAVVFGPPAAGYRERAWRPLSSGVRLALVSGREALVADEPVRALSVEVGRHTAYAADQYAPQVPFSNGGAALYLGFFGGSAEVDGAERPLDVRFQVQGREGDHVVAPEGPAGYAYVGPRAPAVVNGARLVVDPGAPPWLRAAFDHAARAAAGAFAERLGALAEPPLVLIGAGTLDGVGGVEIKGGVVGGQVVYLVEGRGLRTESAAARVLVERLVAHELAHVWQDAARPGGFDANAPWVHEGAAEAMALHALQASGLWTEAEAESYAARAAERCEASTAGRPLAEAVRGGAYDAVTTCGLGLFWGGDEEPFSTWLAWMGGKGRE
jgi:hypothetical protein